MELINVSNRSMSGDQTAGQWKYGLEGPVDHFDVYGEVQTVYSQVYWTRNLPIDLPPELVAKFKGKVMAITGYEVDQVVHPGPKPGDSTRGDQALGGFSCYPDCGKDDKSVPIYHAYNHHYFSWLVGSDSEMYELEDPLFMPNPTKTAFRSKPETGHGYPTNIVFKENPGGEFRKSYHGYPKGYAQLIASPKQWVVEPMQIDTHNRAFNITDQEGYKQWLLPNSVLNNMTSLDSGLSPLIECPCSDRVTQSTVSASSILTEKTCTHPLVSNKECTKAIMEAGAQLSGAKQVSNPKLPSGCLLQPDNARTGLSFSEDGSVAAPSYTAVFNTLTSSNVTCGNTQIIALQGVSKLGNDVELAVEHNTVTAIITMRGPSDVWFGVGFDATAMKDKPYAIIVDGKGAVTERKLADHGPGNELTSSVTLISNSVQDNIRTVVLHRRVQGITKDHFNLPTSPGDLNVISAVGSSSELSYHKARSGGKVTLLPTRDTVCVCQPSETYYLTYMDTSTQQFVKYDCLDRPRSDMKSFGDGTGREVPNMACNMETYHGGLQCCKHSWLLTDRDQDSQIPKDEVDTYYLKWRYYFQEYKPNSTATTASHKHLHHWVFLIDAQVNDYEEDNAEYGKESIGKIAAHLTARDMGLEDFENPTDDGAPPVPKNFSSITPLVITPHCHAPSCIRQELWNADTGEIICNMTAHYGDEKYGSTNNVFNEKDYITILPCLYGYQPGLQFPFDLTPETNITAVKYFNNTYRHLGQMAQWTGLMVYDTDPY